jgi:hypothetical protein
VFQSSVDPHGAMLECVPVPLFLWCAPSLNGVWFPFGGESCGNIPFDTALCIDPCVSNWQPLDKRSTQELGLPS